MVERVTTRWSNEEQIEKPIAPGGPDDVWMNFDACLGHLISLAHRDGIKHIEIDVEAAHAELMAEAMRHVMTTMPSRLKTKKDKAPAPSSDTGVKVS